MNDNQPSDKATQTDSSYAEVQDNTMTKGTERETERAQLTLASTGQRFGNFLIDYFGAPFVFGIFLGLTGSDFGEGINDYVFGIMFMLIYFIPLEAISGITLGKWITGTKAVNNDGSKLTLIKAVGRTICRFIPFEPFSFLGARPEGWHDKIPKTMVISTKRR